MLLRVTGLFAALLALSLALADARACSIMPPGFNPYDTMFKPVGADVLTRSATVDLIKIANPPPPACRRDKNCPDGAGRPVFNAIVLERLKGQSPKSFPLYQQEYGRREPFYDLRTLSAEVHARAAATENASAQNGHTDLAFWDRGELSLNNVAVMYSCGGGPAGLDGKMHYVAFRDQNGTVIALAPITRRDDELLQRLRRNASDPAAFSRTEMTVEAFFKSASALVLVEIVACRLASESEFPDASVRVSRGDWRALTMWTDRWKEHDGVVSSVDVIPEYLSSRGVTKCQPGDRFLLAQMDLPVREIRALGRVELGRRIPELANTKDPRVLYWADTPLTGSYDELRPIPVSGDQISVRDIPTALTLTGADTVSVDQAFAWQARHHADAPQ